MCLRSRTRGSHYIKFACAEIIRKCIIERKKGERKYVRRIKELIIRLLLPTRIVSRSHEKGRDVETDMNVKGRNCSV